MECVVVWRRCNPASDGNPAAVFRPHDSVEFHRVAKCRACELRRVRTSGDEHEGQDATPRPVWCVADEWFGFRVAVKDVAAGIRVDPWRFDMRPGRAVHGANRSPQLSLMQFRDGRKAECDDKMQALFRSAHARAPLASSHSEQPAAFPSASLPVSSARSLRTPSRVSFRISCSPLCPKRH